jgi:hypothetical protein
MYKNMQRYSLNNDQTCDILRISTSCERREEHLSERDVTPLNNSSVFWIIKRREVA